VKILKILKVVAINLITFIVLLFITNWACGLFLKKTGYVGRDQLPNYEANREHAKNIFHDYNSVQHQYEPFVGWKILPYKGKTLHIDQHGDRIHTMLNTSGTVSKSIVFLGGSTMWGEGSDDQHTIPALFNKINPEFIALNRAQLAYNSRQELDALITLYSKNVKPDVVVFYDGVNDAAFLCPSDIEELPAHRLVPLFRSKLYVKKSAFVKEVLNKTFTENILKVMYRISSKPEDSKALYDCLGESGKAEDIADILMKNWELAHEMVTARGGQFIAVLQPAAYIGNPKTDHLKLDQELGKNFAEVYKHIKQKISERKHDWIFDLSNKFDGKDYIYIDFCHVSPNGNEIMAKEISTLVRSLPQNK
jgi:hypothetical protein